MFFQNNKMVIKKSLKFLLLMLIIGLSLFDQVGCNSQKRKLIIFHAGSLAMPFKEASEAFQKIYPDIEILTEASGSVEAARKVTDLHRHADIIGSADYTVIETLLMPKYTDFLVKFATNEMAIMYTEHSRYAHEINDLNWHEILLRKDVNFGRSDPNLDPCGYRALLVWQLAEQYYKIPKLYENLLKKCPYKNIRPKETDLLALLEAGEFDYIFIYRSVAEQHKEKYLSLPDQINLKTDVFKNFYKQAKVDIVGKKPGELIVKYGEPMVYGVTAIKDSPNYEVALKFIEFLVGPEGQKIMVKSGQPAISPPEAVGTIPPVLKKMF